jgi:hypothetical protein
MDDPRHNVALGATRSKGPAASLRRIRLIGRHTLGEALQLRLTLLLGVTGAGLLGGALWLREFNFGDVELKFIADFGLGVVGFFGTLLAVLATAHLFFEDLASGAAGYVLTRPVRRGEYIAGKLAGVAGLLALFTAALGLLLGGLLAWRGAQLGAPPMAARMFFCACGVHWLKCTLVAAMTLLVCSYAGSALFGSCAGLLLALVAHLRAIATEGGGLGWLRVWPNLALFDSESWLAAGQSPSGAWLFGLVAYWAAYLILFGALTSYVFKHREL